MYKKRRIEEIIDKELSKTSVKVRKFAHNENTPDMELKYDIWCNTKKESEDVADKINTLLGKNVADTIGFIDGKYLIVVIFSWEVNNAESYCNEEDKMVKYYSLNNKIVLKGSYEKDLKILSDEDYTWGEI